MEIVRPRPDRVAEIAGRTAERLHRRLPELDHRAVGAGAVDETRACLAAHLERLARLVAAGEGPAAIEVPPAAIVHARALLRRGVPLEVLLRAYHLAHPALRAGIGPTGTTDGAAARDPLAATLRLDAFVFEYTDRVCAAVAALHDRERDRWRHSPAAVRERALDAVLSGAEDVEHCERRLGYAFDGHHQAFVLHTEDEDGGPRRLRETAAAVARVLGAGPPIVFPAGRTARAWCRRTDAFPADPAAAWSAASPGAPSVRIAFGSPLEGVDGFRVSHEEAAHAMAFLARYPSVGGSRGVVTYRAVELRSLLVEDPDRAARFVRLQLGDLAGPGAALRHLRSTTLGYLQHGRSHRRAASALHLHENTVATRVRRAEGVLRTPARSWGAELHAALVIEEIL